MNAREPLSAPRRLVLEIEIPGYYVEDIEDAEDAEAAMQLATDDVGITFAHYSGDDPQLMVRPMEGRIVGWRIANV